VFSGYGKESLRLDTSPAHEVLVSTDKRNTLYKLCEQAAKEQDPDKLLELAQEILRLTDTKRPVPPEGP
jgi:hypothetical protein